MNRAMFYKLRMTNGDEHVIKTNPRKLTGDWAVIDVYWERMDEKYNSCGWAYKDTIHIRPAHIVSYNVFDGYLADRQESPETP